MPYRVKRFIKNKLAIIGLFFVLLFSIAAIAAPYITVHSPEEQYFDGLTLEGSPLPPNEKFWLGTDLLGRDLFARLVYGARTSLIVGILANGIAIFIGTFLGLVAGYTQGFTGNLIMRFTDLMMAFPALLLAIALSAIFSPSLLIVAMVIALVNWVQIARVIYTQTVAIVEQDHIEAAHAIGAKWTRILFVHVLPHLWSTILVWGTLGIATTVLLEATLSFLGIGVRPPTPSWGGIINESQSYFLTAPWLVFFPGISIMLLSMSFNIVGDTLRDIFDPTQRGREE